MEMFLPTYFPWISECENSVFSLNSIFSLLTTNLRYGAGR
jgi:hypothetical protein